MEYKKLKILNCYCGIGGNRKLWEGDIEVTAVEIDKRIAKVYKKQFPADNVIVGEACEYLEKHFRDYDFIWASPPCITHSVMCNSQYNKRLPDMKLYGLIIFLQKWFKGKWVVENVNPYYKPLIKPVVSIDRHSFWANFLITPYKIMKKNDWYIRRAQIPQLCEQHQIDFSIFDVIKEIPELHKGKNQFRRRQILRNCVNPEIGNHIFKCAFKEQQRRLE